MDEQVERIADSEPAQTADPPEFLLAGRHVVLTRALSYLGRVQAARLLFAGARVTLLDLPSLHPDATDLSKDWQDVRFCGVDLNVMPDVHRVAGLLETQGPVDILVNNVAPGLRAQFGPLSVDDFERQLQSNCTAAFVMTRAASEGMKRRGRGSVINVCAPTHQGEWNGLTSHASTNSAIVGLTRSLARELGAHGIRVNSVSPGAVTSPADIRIFGERLAEYDEWVIRNQCLKHRVRAEDVADLVLFLACDRSSMITGQNISVDGGW